MNTFPSPAILALEDGTVFHGRAIGASGSAVGEVVFNTSMTGYQEILSDPSYARQLVTLTYPHIGNTGINPEDMESHRIQAAGLIIRDLSIAVSNWRSTLDLDAYMRGQGLVGIADIDTRSLTRHLREHGAQSACILAPECTNDDASVEAEHVESALQQARAFPGIKGMDLASVVSCAEPWEWTSTVWTPDDKQPPSADLHVVACDFGVKFNILRILVSLGCRVTVVPARSSADDIRRLKPDGVFLANGPGDPAPCEYAIEMIRSFLNEGMPLFGICLGHQLLALAAGAQTFKMKFGHHGANHPVQDLETGEVFITSQNHGFAVDAETLPSHLLPTHRSLFDGTLQGIRHRDRPAFGFQGHPEASPGPHDLIPLFQRFIESMNRNRRAIA